MINVFASTVITGFQDQACLLLQSQLPWFKVLSKSDWFLLYKSTSQISDIIGLPYLNNSFLCLYSSNKKWWNINYFANEVLHQYHKWITLIGFLSRKNLKFRVMSYFENEPTKIEWRVTKIIEQKIIQKYRNLSIDSMNPDIEFWISMRKWEEWRFMLRLTKKNSRKWMEKWEMRTEFCYLMSSLAHIQRDDIVMDPFAWHWSISRTINEYFSCKKIIINDINNEDINYCKSKIIKHWSEIVFSNTNALRFDTNELWVINHIVTDPPWGIFEVLKPSPEVFYEIFLGCFFKILSHWGNLVFCSSQKELSKKMLLKVWFTLKSEINTLLSGKKVSIFVAQKNA